MSIADINATTLIHPARAQVPPSYQSERDAGRKPLIRDESEDGNGTSVRLCKHAGDAANHESKSWIFLGPSNRCDRYFRPPKRLHSLDVLVKSGEIIQNALIPRSAFLYRQRLS